MKINGFSQMGKRKNNEDFQGKNECVITVCDGMGGHAAGEVASRFVVEQVLNMFPEKGDDLNKDVINKRLTSIQNQFNKLLEQNPEKEGMGTTFTGLFVGDNFWFVAHIGDSRVYFVRPSEKLIWHTWDHSMVGDLMRMNEITRERGRNHPMANRISRAVMANSDGKTVLADVAKIDNIQEGDLFLLCSDGVGDAWRDDEICELLCNESITAEEKLSKIKEKCYAESNDNNTAYLAEVEKSDEIDNGDNQELKWIPLKDLQSNYQQYLREEAEEDENVQLVEDEPDEKKEDKNPIENQESEEPNKQPVADNAEEHHTIEQIIEKAKDYDYKALYEKYKKIVIGAAIIIVIMLLALIGNRNEKTKVFFEKVKKIEWLKKNKIKSEEEKNSVQLDLTTGHQTVAPGHQKTSA